MRLRIIREVPPLFNGYDTAGLHLGETYEVGRSLADILVATRFAVPEEGVATAAPAPPPESGPKPGD